MAPLRSLLATWFPRVNEIITLIGSHNLLATPSRRQQLDDVTLRPLIGEFLHGAGVVGAEDRAWDFVASSLAGRNVLYERSYLTSAGRNRISHHLPERRSRPRLWARRRDPGGWPQGEEAHRCLIQFFKG